MDKEKEYVLKIDVRKFFQSLSTEELRTVRDGIKEELKKRDHARRKNMKPPKPEYCVWTGKIVRRIGDVFGRYRFRVEPSNPDELPEAVMEKVGITFFSLQSGAFKKDTCPKIGDVVQVRYRIFKRTSIFTSFSQGKIIGLAPRKVVGCKREWNCLNIIAYDDKSRCPDCIDAIKE